MAVLPLQLLGMNVSDARRSCSTNGRWGVDIMKHIGQHMLESIAGVHKLGFIHRDIKPANFALTPRHAPPSEGRPLSCPGVNRLLPQPHRSVPADVCCLVTQKCRTQNDNRSSTLFLQVPGMFWTLGWRGNLSRRMAQSLRRGTGRSFEARPPTHPWLLTSSRTWVSTNLAPSICGALIALQMHQQ